MRVFLLATAACSIALLGCSVDSEEITTTPEHEGVSFYHNVKTDDSFDSSDFSDDDKALSQEFDRVLPGIEGYSALSDLIHVEVRDNLTDKSDSPELWFVYEKDPFNDTEGNKVMTEMLAETLPHLHSPEVVGVRVLTKDYESISFDFIERY